MEKRKVAQRTADHPEIGIYVFCGYRNRRDAMISKSVKVPINPDTTLSYGR